ncbi:hypothetical protein V1278_006634 [Bradyrhizobium sp. AZCC 1577]|uniref:KAP family P-loop NTPase fold protein n=1 Tax=unclassified Bradyrhizobium TaxID=2631580 RepID=UPI002FEF28EC
MVTQPATTEVANSNQQIWAQDRLGRAEDASFLRAFLLGRIREREEAGLPASYVLNIDAEWGRGKSFFLSRFGKQLAAEGFVVAHVNAWQDDHAEDPLLSVMDAIDQAVAPLVKKEKRARDRWEAAKRTGGALAVAAAKGATVHLARKVLGSGIDEIGSILKTGVPEGAEKSVEDISKKLGDIVDEQGKNLLATFREAKRTIATFRRNLGAFLEVLSSKNQPLPLFVFVDELDRCRPPFAIAMLERMKHLFDIDQVVFIVATDTVQLSHSVGAVYGSGFNSEGYLARFFNRTYHFDRVSNRDFIGELLRRQPIAESKISLPPQIDLESYLTGGFDFFGLPPRDIEQVYDILRSFVTAWTGKAKVEMAFLYPIVVAHQQKVELSLDGNFTSHLNRIMQRFMKSEVPWKIQFGRESQYGEKAEYVSGIALAGDFAAHIQRGLNDLNHEATARHQRWVVQRLSEEFAAVHSSTFWPGTKIQSVLWQYPDMVRSAGRLVSEPTKRQS